MISLEEVLKLHEKSIRDFGGSLGIRDKNLLESALSRSFQSFGNVEFYPSIFEKTAALIESIVKNHPFVDGNKRTGFLAAYFFLFRNNYELTASQETAYEFVINIASSQISFEQIVEAIQQNSILIES